MYKYTQACYRIVRASFLHRCLIKKIGYMCNNGINTHTYCTYIHTYTQNYNTKNIPCEILNMHTYIKKYIYILYVYIQRSLFGWLRSFVIRLPISMRAGFFHQKNSAVDDLRLVIFRNVHKLIEYIFPQVLHARGIMNNKLNNPLYIHTLHLWIVMISSVQWSLKENIKYLQRW